jgi:hypothetical protein
MLFEKTVMRAAGTGIVSRPVTRLPAASFNPFTTTMSASLPGPVYGWGDE